MAVGLLHLGILLCHPHQCSLPGAEVDNLASHGLSCRQSKGRHPQHAVLNEIIHKSSRILWCILLRQEAPRWHFCGALEAREGIGLECNMPRHICTFISSKCCNVFWGCSTTGRTFGFKPPLRLGGCGDFRGAPIVPGPRTLPQEGNWEAKVLPFSHPKRICG